MARALALVVELELRFGVGAEDAAEPDGDSVDIEAPPCGLDGDFAEQGRFQRRRAMVDIVEPLRSEAHAIEAVRLLPSTKA